MTTEAPIESPALADDYYAPSLLSRRFIKARNADPSPEKHIHPSQNGAVHRAINALFHASKPGISKSAQKAFLGTAEYEAECGILVIGELQAYVKENTPVVASHPLDDPSSAII
jgi:hypothetical protein